jgi:hypothetical protein
MLIGYIALTLAQSVVQFSEECYLDYSMYVVLERALLFVGDRIMFHNKFGLLDVCLFFS